MSNMSSIYEANMIQFIKDLFNPPDPYFKLDPKKSYTEVELLFILENSIMRVGTGHNIIMKLLEMHEKRIHDLEKKNE